MNPSSALHYARIHRTRFVSELKEFIRFPTVSSQPGHARDIENCARWLAAHLQLIGLEHVRVVATRGNPIVCAAWQHNVNCPTILIYGHYDVLPGEPLREWQMPPFEPTILNGKLHGRGASDDKGQLFTHIKAIECYLATQNTLPVNVKCIFEGEEEIGSTTLTSFISRNRRALRADAAVISDTRMLAPGLPAISYAQRGGLRAELQICGPAKELHSGNFGGAIHNPLQVLCEMIARMHDADGRVAIPGFYDDVREWSGIERDFMARSGPTDDHILRDAMVHHGWGEAGFSAYERTTIRPALTLNGMTGGHQGVGAKSIIPAQAVAKLSFRLVPDQNPQIIAQLFRSYVERITPPTVRASVRTFSPIEPALVDRTHPAVRAAVLAYQKSFEAKPVFVRSGGSIPVVNTFKTVLGIPTVLMGFGLPGDHIHAPNENFKLSNFYRGVATSIYYLDLAGKLPHSRSRQIKWQSAAELEHRF